MGTENAPNHFQPFLSHQTPGPDAPVLQKPMSYLVLARKWRPQNFGAVVGQPHVARTLQNAILSGRVAHAYLFTGARGVGKTSVARIFAKSLNCLQGLSSLPCEGCSNCKEIVQGNSPDVLEIDGASNRGIDSIRELRETVRYRPAKSRYKVYIIDEVHMLTPEAFNALLKTLEEPPEHVLFIFATTEPHKIPLTILSRCQRFDFRRIPMSLLVEHLQRIAAQESLAASEAILYAIAREADGSVRDALSLLEQLLAFSGDGLDDQEILDILGVVDRQSVVRAGQAILDGDVKECLETVEAVYCRGIDTRRFCQQLCDHFRNLLLLALGQGLGRLEVSSEEAQRLEAQAGKASAESLFLYFQVLLKGEEDIRRSSLPRITLEMLLLRLAKAPRLDSLQSIMGKLDSLESLMRGGNFSACSPEGARSAPSMEEVSTASMEPPEPQWETAPREFAEREPEEERPLDFLADPSAPLGSKANEGGGKPVGEQAVPEDMPQRWPAFVRWVQGRDPVMGAKLDKSILSLEGEKANLQVLEIFEEGLKSEGALLKLQDAAAEYFKSRCQWTVTSKSAAPRRGQELQEGTSRSGSRRLVLQNPVVLQALEILGGELVDIKPSKGAGRKKGGEVESAE